MQFCPKSIFNWINETEELSNLVKYIILFKIDLGEIATLFWPNIIKILLTCILLSVGTYLECHVFGF